MFIREKIRYTNKGVSAVFQLVKSERVNGKPRQKVLFHLGTLKYNDKREDGNYYTTQVDLAEFWDEWRFDEIYSIKVDQLKSGINKDEMKWVESELEKRVPYPTHQGWIEYYLIEREKAAKKLNAATKKGWGYLGGLEAQHNLEIGSAERELRHLGVEEVPKIQLHGFAQQCLTAWNNEELPSKQIEDVIDFLSEQVVPTEKVEALQTLCAKVVLHFLCSIKPEITIPEKVISRNQVNVRVK